jgi:hypothetical protein
MDFKLLAFLLIFVQLTWTTVSSNEVELTGEQKDTMSASYTEHRRQKRSAGTKSTFFGIYEV